MPEKTFSLSLESSNSRMRQQTAWPFALLLSLSLLACYAPVVFEPYAFTDDYSLYYSASVQNNFVDRYQVIASGRPLYAFLLELTFTKLKEIGDLRYIRLAGVIGIIAFGLLILRGLSTKGWSIMQSALIAFIICTLPSFQVYAAWATTAFFPYAALMAVCASLLVERTDGSPVRSHIVFPLAAILLLAVAVMVYQPVAMMYWFFVSIAMMDRLNADCIKIRRLVIHLSVMFTALGLGFAAYTVGQWLYPGVIPPGRAGLTRSISAKLLWFLKEPLVNALNLHDITPKRSIALIAAMLTVPGLYLYLRGSFIHRFGGLLLLTCLVPLSFLPNLVAAENSAAYRSLTVLSCLTAFYVLVALKGFMMQFKKPLHNAILTLMLVIAAAASGFAAHRNIGTCFIHPQLTEASLLRDSLSKVDAGKIDTLYFVMSTWHDYIAPVIRYDEFGALSTSMPWSSRAMVLLTYPELHRGAHVPHVAILSQDDPALPAEGMTIINMKTVLEARKSSLCALLTRRFTGDIAGDISCQDESIYIHPGVTTPSRVVINLGGRYNRIQMAFEFRNADQIPKRCRVDAGEVELSVTADSESFYNGLVRYTSPVTRSFCVSNMHRLELVVDKGRNGPDCDWFTVKIDRLE